MCDFKPGDEVVCVDDKPKTLYRPWSGTVVEGQVYVVAGYTTPPEGHLDHGAVSVVIVGAPNIDMKWGVDIGYKPSRFRKVQKRDSSLSIEAFLTIKPGFEEPRRPKAPAKRRERA